MSFEIKIGTSIWQVMQNVDLTGLNVEKTNKNVTFLSGKVIFSGIDYTSLLNKRFTGITQIECRWGGFYGYLSLDGDWHYDRSVCELSVGDMETFDTILSLESQPQNLEYAFQYNAYTYRRYATDGYTPQNYLELPFTYPLDWNPLRIYSGADKIDDGPPQVWIGDDDNTCFYDGQWYFSKTANNLGNQPDISPDEWFLPTGLNPKTYVQTRSKFKFHTDAIYNQINLYWAYAVDAGGYYDGTFTGVNVKTEINRIITEHGFTLAADWLAHAAAINSRYDGSLILANTEFNEKVTLQGLIDIIKQAFNVDWYLIGGTELTFKHPSEVEQGWSGSLPAEHDLSDYDIFDWSRGDEGNVKRHVLKFTESTLGTHDNSYLEYFNNFKENKEVKSTFDVDFVYGFNQESTPMLITYDTTGGDIDNLLGVFNPYLIPSLLHEEFYLFGREFTRGELNENLVSLTLDYLEKSDRELQGNFDINNWDAMTQIKINGFAGSDARYALMEKVVYSIDKHNFKISLKTKIQ